MLLISVLLGTALGQDCDSRALTRQVTEASPLAVSRHFTALAACHPASAKRQVSGVFERMITGPDTLDALKAAMALDENDRVRSWVASLRSDERSTVIASIGNACADSELVADFLVESHEVLGERFWSERWYRSLADCRVEGIQEILISEISEPSDDRSRFLSVLEAYARNLGPESLPRLTELALSMTTSEEQIYIVNAFADAGRVGSLEGPHPGAALAAITALLALVPDLQQGRPQEQARTTLRSLGAEEAAEHLARIYYQERAWPDERLHYGLIVVETALCRNGKYKVGVHTGRIAEPGRIFPSDLAGPATESAQSTWELDLAERCRGTQELTVLVPELPAADSAEIEAWTAETLESIEIPPRARRTDIPEEGELEL